MIKIDLMNGCKAERVRSGESGRGPWELIVVKDSGKARKEISIWVNNNPSGIVEGQMFRVTNITCIKYGARKDGNGNWRDDVSIEADVESMSYTGSNSDFGSSADFSDLPFEMSGDPFASSSNDYFSASDPFAESDDKLPL